MNISPYILAFANDAKTGEYAKLLKTTDITLTDEEYAEPDMNLVYAHCVSHIAAEAPIRILKGELLVGASTLAEARGHNVPVKKQNGQGMIMPSLSHTTLGFADALKIGYKGIREKLEKYSEINLGEKEQNFYKASFEVLDAAKLWHERYLRELRKRIFLAEGKEKEDYAEVLKNLENVPENPPTDFKEALQSLLFMFIFQRLCGNWPGVGRVDVMLGDFLEKDLSTGAITMQEARDYVAFFLIRGCDWAICDGSGYRGSGDAQHYQNIVLSGVDENGFEVDNAVTRLFIDVQAELMISDWPIAVRISPRSSDSLLRLIAEAEKKGSGTVAVYNNDFIINNLTRFGYPLKEARGFANDGCWEIQVPGKTAFSYQPFDTLNLFQNAVYGDAGSKCESVEELYALFYIELKKHLDNFEKGADGFNIGGGNILFSLLVEGCIEKGRDYADRGPKYTVLAPHAGGIPDVANAFSAIEKFVYTEKLLTLPELIDNMKNNWEGNEELRLRIRNNTECYGTYGKNNRGNYWARRILHDFCDYCALFKLQEGVYRPAGVSTFGREIAWRNERTATADGHKKGDILAANLTPSPGTDIDGPTASVLSCCDLDLSGLVNGMALDLKLDPKSTEGEAGTEAMVALYKVFIKNGGIFMNIDSVSAETLRAAQANPDAYRTLAVRVSGWSARFVTLDEEWQKMIIGHVERAIR